MSWHPATNLSHLIRDRQLLRITCRCGHRADFDPMDLRSQLWDRGASIELADLPRAMRCGQCGSRRFTWRAVAAD